MLIENESINFQIFFRFSCFLLIAESFLRTSRLENCSHLGTNNVK